MRRDIYLLVLIKLSLKNRLAQEMTRSLSQTVVYQPNAETSNEIDQEWRKAMEQLQQEEEAERKAGTFDYGFQPIEDGDDSLHV